MEAKQSAPPIPLTATNGFFPAGFVSRFSVTSLKTVSRNTSAEMKPLPMSSNGESTFAVFICSRVCFFFTSASTTFTMSFNRADSFFTSSMVDTSPCPGMTFTSAGSDATTLSIAAMIPRTVPPPPTSTSGNP